MVPTNPAATPSINTGAYKIVIGRITPADLATVLMNNFHYAKDLGGNLYCYDEQSGIYKANAEIMINWQYCQLLTEQDGSTAQWKSRVLEEIIKYIRRHISVPYMWEQPPTDKINLNNGIWDISQERLLPHTHEYMSMTRVPITYDPSATCPRWDKFLDDLIPVNGGRQFLYEIAGLCMTSATSMQVAIILLGSGSNGKSTYLKAVERLLGIENVSKVDLRTLCNPNDRFTTYALKDKLLNYVDDASQAKLIDTAAIKSLITGDRIRVEQKGKDAHFIKPFCKFIFSTNDLIHSEDHTTGYKRRWYYVPFVQTFKVAMSEGDDLDMELADPREQSGVLNRVLPLLLKVTLEGFTLTEELSQIVDTYLPVSPQLEAWLKDNVITIINGYLPINAFYLYLVENATRFHDRPWEKKDVYGIMKRMFSAEIVRVKIRGVYTRCFVNVKMRDAALQQKFEGYNIKDDKE